MAKGPEWVDEAEEDIVRPRQQHRERRGGGTYLLDGSVLDSVGIVVVVNDFKVSHGLALGRPSEVHVQLGLAGSLGQHRKVSRLSNLHTWKPPKRRQ